jgi:hypothetical protein
MLAIFDTQVLVDMLRALLFRPYDEYDGWSSLSNSRTREICA